MSASASAPVIRFGRFETELSAAGEHENPVQDVRVEVDFLGPGGERRTREAFWYGGKTWKVRFSPSQAGEWSYRTRASVEKDEGLHGRAGSFTCVSGSASNPLYRRGRLQVSKDRRHLVHADGTPFFWLADTAWNGPLKADAASFERYLDDRAAKGFNAVQFVATQWRSAAGNADGRPAFYGREKIAIDPEFYQWMDERLHAMNERGIVAAPVLIWAVGGRTAPLNPGQFLPDDQIVVLARYMVARWGAHHVVFFLAGDDDYRGEKAERWRKIGRAVFGDAAPGHLVTMHPGGRMWVAEEFRREPWFSFNGYQSGHGDAPDHLRWLTEGPPAQEWAKEPALPHINLEPNYEAHIARPSGKLFDAKAVRRAAYWSLLATPTAGVSYGGHGVWSWELAPRLPMTHPYTGVARPWHEAIQLPGSIGMKHLKQVFTSLRWWTLRPDPDLVVDQPGRKAAERFIAAARSQSGDAALLYVPEGGEVTLRTDRLAPPASASWFDPVTGARREAGRVVGRGEQRFEADPGQDWLLVIQSEPAKASSTVPSGREQQPDLP